VATTHKDIEMNTHERYIKALEHLESPTQGRVITAPTAGQVAQVIGHTPQHARRVLNHLVDIGKIRMSVLPHRPNHPIERLRYKSVYMLTHNYVEQLELFKESD
jgi:hypothetical protein